MVVRMQKRNRVQIYHCSFCGKVQSEVKRLIAGPGGCFVCDACVQKFGQEEHQGQPKRAAYCSFCGKNEQQTSFLVAGMKNTHICDECLELCQDILDEEDEKKV